MSLYEWDWLHQNKRVNSGDDWKSYKTGALGKGKGGVGRKGRHGKERFKMIN